MPSDFHAQYDQLDDEQLLEVASDRADLTQDAVFALDAEIRKRGLSAGELSEHRRFVKWSNRREQRILRMKAYGPRTRRNNLIFVFMVVVAITTMIVLLTR